jgi:hypothetical protein
MDHSDTSEFRWSAERIGRFYGIVDQETGEVDTAEVYYRHKRGQLPGVFNVGRSLVLHVPTALKAFTFNKENAA